jgi:uridylate kinase
VYDKDPNKHDTAKHLPELSYQDAVADNDIKVMDKAAMGLAMEQRMPLVVFDAMQADNILKVVQRQAVGTIIS